MSSKRRTIIRRVDGNQSEIVDALRAKSYGVLDIHSVGGGAPDLVVSDQLGNIALVEIKQLGSTFTIGELDFARKWPGEIVVAFSARDVIDWFARHNA